ncbi:Cytochrome P450 [Macleaya cordata]|uniref:Cytochrome P450 n=1 Tax=Macleaya cordata TaxID=56857 RepID=A0A200RCX6_MACCD|nr:Cytochrome P450 [Macleaya cordata]
MGLIYFLFQDYLCIIRTHSNLFILLLVFITPLLVLFTQLRRKNNEGSRGSWRLPPGPNRLPLIGNLHQLGDLPHLSLQKLSYEYGPLMFLRLGLVPTLVVSSADMAKEIFRTHDLVFSGRPVLYAAKKLSYGCVAISVAPYGEYWREVKKITILEMLSAKRVRSFRAVREEEVAAVIDFVRKSSSSSSSVPINLSEMMLCLVNNVICRVTFGRKYEGVSNGKSKFHGVLIETQDLLAGFSTADFFPWMGWIHKFDGLEARLEKNFRQLDDFYDKVIDEHLNSQRPNPELEDLVDVLLRIQKDPSQGTTLNRDQIKGILTDMFIAGSDTSSATIVWTMTELIRNPTVMKRAQEDVRRNVGNKEVVEESDLPKLSYLKLVIKEAMRLHPPAPLLVPRETTENCTIMGYDIPAKTRVFFNAKAIAKDPKYWENPEVFQPERFLDNNIEFKGHNFELIPFGAGRRACPGINFAVVLIELVLANLLHCFDWELPPGQKREEVDMREASGITMHKKLPLCLVADIANVGKNA